MIEDNDPSETREWLDALDAVVKSSGSARASFLLIELAKHAADEGMRLPPAITTPFRNTIRSAEERVMPGDLFMERRIRSLVRWNALAMVMRANDNDDGLGGHISSFSSSATLYDIGFNYFFRGTDSGHPGDLVFYQGHSAPGMYARSYLEGRLDEDQLDRFRREVDGNGLSSYPHPWLMPDYWQFPTVSMGLGPLQAIYQAHVMKYQQSRGLLDHGDRNVWCFLGDGECDEPESLGAISMAGREQLGNLIFVVNCNLQRLDGPVRGNGKIIQELEGVFRGAGWDVLKVIWGRKWDPLLEKDESGMLQQRMDEVCDGELQNYKYNGGAYTREHFFGKYPESAELVKDLSDDDIMYLNRGGHDPYKVYAAYAAAVEQNERPTVVLAMTVKGYGTGEAGEANNETHSLKKLDLDSLKAFRDRFAIPISDTELKDVPFYRPPPDSPEIRYMKQRRAELGGAIPARRSEMERLPMPGLEAFSSQLKGSGKREISTTMAFVRMLSSLVKDKQIGERVVPIVPDEARTFGMEGMFRQLGIYSSAGQKYTPHDSGQIMFYKEDKQGQILEEGINEAGAFSAWLAAATSYSTSGYSMVPFYIYYSMFGFQRIGDLAWAAGDSQARGFLIGATAGRTTLNGEGLQHQDGHSHVQAGTIPNCVSYDPAYAFELAVIIQDGLRRMYVEGENTFYYITTMNENYLQPEMPEGVEEGIIKGMYCLHRSSAQKAQRVHFESMVDVVTERGLNKKVDGVLLDIGVSSPQLDDAVRGFSFLKPGPLDMRMNTGAGQSASQWLAKVEEHDLFVVLKKYGEERFARRIARAVVEMRQQEDITDTLQLAELISSAVPVKEKHKHPATRSFQAIRIYINRELEVLESALKAAVEILAVNGRLVVISFHSLEDRIVKRFMRDLARGPQLPKDFPVMESDIDVPYKLIGKAVKPSEQEIAENPRSRSSVLRVLERTH